MVVGLVLHKSIKQVVKRLLGMRTESQPIPTPNKTRIWSIGIYAGKSPLDLRPAHPVSNPVLTSDSVSDVPASFVADPFMLKVHGTWHMFFEVMNEQSGRGEIGLAVSQDALQWRYQQIVLQEPFHLSYPYTFEWQNAYYMVPETYQAKSVRLYKAVEFPTRWMLVTTLLDGDDFVDPTIFHYKDHWWLFTDLSRSPYYAGTLRLFHADRLEGPWAEHPQSPIIQANPHIARPAGRVVSLDGSILRYTQDCCPEYGKRVYAFEIKELTTATYREEPVDVAPIIDASGEGWNGSGMHHIDPHLADDMTWIACVDGWYSKELS